ncbi:tyrosine--tRNA ligase [Glutamicibacter soli]|uniref:Tyrosine--tRNA ligase n=1 Tax=Glutamicibacter soli TaxID=453836 RepID=A0A365YJU3_9MICC|nr:MULTISPECIES: tyrosine--tRNA ligase [Micrococcaceae]ALQ31283.1 tyrosine--tRNA ligase [Arthrobacter sp. YC-RL1]KLI87442.1 tyrosyl-tRNA synthetase [Arthrobacter sp. YC-RL1]NAZ17064.1 tyrosine--tRNA ligase [Glutamicibacter soli]RBM02530.1 tyrosine--tRNA ligase [Glutamicibacter soli]RKS20574.1 tyrosyl-tRNA synthetase [Arthrobacter sp. AG1021]
MSETNQNPVIAGQSNDSSFANVWQELKWRGLVHVSTDEAELERALSEETITYYCGFDPTAPSLHLGNLVQLLNMRRLQLAGHKPLALVGGSTGLIGDPRQTAERTLNTKETVTEWVAKLQAQVSRFLSNEGENAVRLVNNLDWTAPLSALDFLRDVGKYFRVGTMIKKEIVAARLNSDEGISYTEFSYQVLQGYDYLELYRQYGCTLQTGGSDQWGNLTSGTDLIRKVEGKSAYAYGTPLITNSDGTKFGKSEGNAIWLDAEMCSPYTFYQFWLNTADADVIDRLKVFTFMSREQIEALAVEVAERPFKRQAQRELAWQVTSLVHGEDATTKVIAASAAVFGNGELGEIDLSTLQAVIAELPIVQVAADDLGILNVLHASGLSESLSAARRTVGEGGAYVNNEKVEGIDSELSEADFLHGRYAIVRRGKKNMAVVELTK